jgi:hypothetical protein
LAGCNGYVTSFYDDDGNYYDSSYLITNCPTSAIQNVKIRIDSVLKFALYDVLDLHLYDDVELWDEYYANFSDSITKPIIVSEFGGPNMNYENYSESFQTNRLYQYIKKLDSLQIQEAYYFKLVEGTSNLAHSTSGLISDTTLIEKSSYYLFKSFIDCLTFVNEFENKSEIHIYPNPFSNQAILQSDTPFNNVTFTLVNCFGQTVSEIKNINGQTTILSFDNLAGGLYFVKLTENNRIIGKAKLLITN